MGNTIFIIILVIVLIASILFVFKNRVYTLYIGLTKNLHIRNLLSKYVNKNDYLYLRNLCLRIAPGHYINVDHIIIGDRFIYVIAAKFYLGFLSGKDTDEKWVLSDGKNTDLIENPLLVNEIKINYIAQILRVNPNVLVNIVLLSRTAHLDSTIDIRNSSLHLMEENNVIKLMERYEADTNYPVFSSTDLERTASELYEYHRASVDDKRMSGKGKWNH